TCALPILVRAQSWWKTWRTMSPLSGYRPEGQANESGPLGCTPQRPNPARFRRRGQTDRPRREERSRVYALWCPLRNVAFTPNAVQHLLRRCMHLLSRLSTALNAGCLTYFGSLPTHPAVFCSEIAWIELNCCNVAPDHHRDLKSQGLFEQLLLLCERAGSFRCDRARQIVDAVVRIDPRYDCGVRE